MTAPVSLESVVGRPATVGVTVWDAPPSLVTPTLKCGRLARVHRRVQARLAHQQRVALRAAAVDGLGELHGLERVDQPGALVVGRRAQVGGRADDDLLDERRRRQVAVVRLGVGLMHQRGGGRRSPAPTRWCRPAAQIGGGLEPWSMSAQPKNFVVSLLHSDQPRSPGATTSTVCGLNSLMPSELSARDVVVLPAAGRQLRAVPGGLAVDAVGGGPADRDHAGRGGRRSRCC